MEVDRWCALCNVSCTLSETSKCCSKCLERVGIKTLAIKKAEGSTETKLVAGV